jgi:hypothetical protein
MSAPVSPTWVKRKRKLADAAQTRRSLASAITAPAPAARPLTAAITGLSSRRIALTTSPVMRANSSTPFMSRFSSSPMISWTSPPLQKPRPVPVTTSTLYRSSRRAPSKSRTSSA